MSSSITVIVLQIVPPPFEVALLIDLDEGSYYFVSDFCWFGTCPDSEWIEFIDSDASTARTVRIIGSAIIWEFC